MVPSGMPTDAAVPVAAVMQAAAPARAVGPVDHARSQHDERDRAGRPRAYNHMPPVTVTNDDAPPVTVTIDVPPVSIAANDGTAGFDLAARPTLATLTGLAALFTARLAFAVILGVLFLDLRRLAALRIGDIRGNSYAGQDDQRGRRSKIRSFGSGQHGSTLSVTPHTTRIRRGGGSRKMEIII